MQIRTYNNSEIELPLPPAADATKLVALPALVDPHVHFRVPGGEQKEDWGTGARAATAGGVTTVLDMPNNTPPTTTAELLKQKQGLIHAQLTEANIPLHYKLFFGATADNFEEIKKVANDIAGIKLFMGASTGNLLVEKKASQEKIFALGHELNLVVAVHAEDNAILRAAKNNVPYPHVTDHSALRPREAAITAVTGAIAMAKKFSTRTYILHVSTQEEIELIRQAKASRVPIFAEVTPHHLFLNEGSYNQIGSKAQMNPPLRTQADQDALWAAITDGTIDTVGTDHAPQLISEKATPYPESPSGVPGIETSLPLLLHAHHLGKISLEKIVALTSTNARSIFGLPKTNDWVVVDLALTKDVVDRKLKTKCRWSPFNGWHITGWPVYTVLNDKIYAAAAAP